MRLLRLLLLLLLVPPFLALICHAAAPNMVFNNLTGSNTTASGAPSTFGPFSAVATCHTGGVLTNVITWAANPLAGVPVDGSALLWMATGAPSCPGFIIGCRFAPISARAAGTVTLDGTSYNIPAGAPVDCAVGGKRLSLDGEARAWRDARLGWQYEIENTGTNYTVAVSLQIASLPSPFWPRVYIRGTGAARPVIQATAAITVFDITDAVYFENLSFLGTGGGAPTGSGQSLMVMRNIKVDGFAGYHAGNAGRGNVSYQVEVANGGMTAAGSRGELVLDAYQHNSSSGTGVSIGAGTFMYVITANNAANGIGGGNEILLHVTSYGNGNDGMEFGATSNGLVVAGSLFSNNTVDGIQGTTTDQTVNGLFFNGNAFFANAVNYNNAPAGANDTTGVDPGFVNPLLANWAIGPALQNLGWPQNTLVAGIASLTTTNTEPGASQRRGSGAAHYAY